MSGFGSTANVRFLGSAGERFLFPARYLRSCLHAVAVKAGASTGIASQGNNDAGF
jgi:hypothetical protein